MSIEWKGTLAYADKQVVASIRKHVTTGWYASHLTWVYKNLNPITKPCKTEAGIKRRVERYANIWVVAGKPKEEHK